MTFGCADRRVASSLTGGGRLGSAQFPAKFVHLSPYGFQLGVVVSFQSRVALLLQFFHLRLDAGLVDACCRCFVVRVHVDIQSLAHRDQEVLFVQLSVSLHGIVLDSGGNFTKLGDCHGLELLVSVGHDLDSPFRIAPLTAAGQAGSHLYNKAGLEYQPLLSLYSDDRDRENDVPVLG